MEITRSATAARDKVSDICLPVLNVQSVGATTAVSVVSTKASDPFILFVVEDLPVLIYGSHLISKLDYRSIFNAVDELMIADHDE